MEPPPFFLPHSQLSMSGSQGNENIKITSPVADITVSHIRFPPPRLAVKVSLTIHYRAQINLYPPSRDG